MALEKKEYLFNFIGGGWNSEFAKTKRSAIAQAKKRFKGDRICIVDEKSFRLSTPADYQANMSLFY
jgi:hypothetical protein